jgi:hypothetical protein
LNYGVLSFCADLTDPSAESVPLGIVGAGVAGNRDRFWFFVIKNPPWDHPVIQSDPLAKSVLAGLPELLKRQVREGASRVETRKFSSWLHDQFRNSLHVSDVKREVFQARSGDPQKEVMNHCIGVYRDTVQPARRNRWQEPMPEVTFQSLPEEDPRLVTTA